MLRCVADESWPMDLKSFSPDHPSGSTGRGNEKWTAAIFVAVHNLLLDARGFVLYNNFRR